MGEIRCGPWRGTAESQKGVAEQCVGGEGVSSHSLGRYWGGTGGHTVFAGHSSWCHQILQGNLLVFKCAIGY